MGLATATVKYYQYKLLNQMTDELREIGVDVPGSVLSTFHKEEDPRAISQVARLQTRTVRVYLLLRLLFLSLLGCIPENGGSCVKPLLLFRLDRGQIV